MSTVLYGILIDERDRLERLIKLYKEPEQLSLKTDRERALPPGEFQRQREERIKDCEYNLGEVKVALKAMDKYNEENKQQ